MYPILLRPKLDHFDIRIYPIHQRTGVLNPRIDEDNRARWGCTRGHISTDLRIPDS